MKLGIIPAAFRELRRRAVVASTMSKNRRPYVATHSQDATYVATWNAIERR
jgi:hypothetical protein